MTTIHLRACCVHLVKCAYWTFGVNGNIVYILNRRVNYILIGHRWRNEKHFPGSAFILILGGSICWYQTSLKFASKEIFLKGGKKYKTLPCEVVMLKCYHTFMKYCLDCSNVLQEFYHKYTHTWWRVLWEIRNRSNVFNFFPIITDQRMFDNKWTLLFSTMVLRFKIEAMHLCY